MINNILKNFSDNMNLKTKIYIAIFVFAGFIALYYTFLSKENETLKPISTPQIVDEMPNALNYPINQKENKNFKIDEVTFKPQELPTKLPVYNYKSTKIDDLIVTKIISALGMEYQTQFDDPIIGRTLKSQTSTKSLIIYQEKGTFNYSDSSDIKSFLSRDDMEYKKRADDLIQKFGIDSSTLEFDSLQYFTVLKQSEIELTSVKSLANLAAISYLHKKDGHEIIQSGKIYPAGITIWVDDSNTIKKVTGSVTGTVLERVGVSDFEPIETIRQNVINGKPRLVQSYMNNQGNPTAVTANSIEVVYYESDNKIIPIYRIYGKIFINSESGIGLMYMDTK